jgi:hypothetical protein
MLAKSAALLRLERRLLCSRKKSDASARARWQKWTHSFLQLRRSGARRLSSASFEERRPARSIRPAITRPTANWGRTMTSIISCLVSSPKNPATNESFSTSRRDVGDCKFARTWISPSSVANTRTRVRTCCSCRLGILISIDGYTRAWLCCAPSKMASPWRVRPAMDY